MSVTRFCAVTGIGRATWYRWSTWRARSRSARPPSDAISVFEAALAEVEALLGVTWVEDLTDPGDAEIATLRLVTDNGPCSTSARFGASVASKHHIAHIRTRRRAPWTNGVIERFFAAIKYEHLYRREITTGVELASQVDSFRAIYNTIRSHEAIAMRQPSSATDRRRPPNPQTSKMSQLLDTRQHLPARDRCVRGSPQRAPTAMEGGRTC